MKYITGEEIVIGDLVLIERGKTFGVVHSVLEKNIQMQQWGVDEAGIVIESEPFGLIFWPILESEDPVIFKERLKQA